jgi:hypothetical protein
MYYHFLILAKNLHLLVDYLMKYFEALLLRNVCFVKL